MTQVKDVRTTHVRLEHIERRPPWTIFCKTEEHIMLIKSIRGRARFGKQRFEPVQIAKTAHSDTKVVGLEAGQTIPVHHPGSDLTMMIIEGEATLISGNEELAHAGPGAVMHAAAGEARGIRADQRTIPWWSPAHRRCRKTTASWPSTLPGGHGAIDPVIIYRRPSPSSCGRAADRSQ